MLLNEKALKELFTSRGAPYSSCRDSERTEIWQSFSAHELVSSAVTQLQRVKSITTTQLCNSRHHLAAAILLQSANSTKFAKHS